MKCVSINRKLTKSELPKYVPKKYHPETYVNRGYICSGIWVEKKVGSSCGKDIQIIKFDYDHAWGRTGYIIQKYIIDPKLIDGYKFDIRIMVALRSNKTFYVHQDGIIRLSVEKYDTNNFDETKHLTNLSISRKYKNDINIRMLSGLQKYKEYMEKINSICHETFHNFFLINNSTYENSYCILGLDFIIDSTENIFLLECNSKPHFGKEHKSFYENFMNALSI